MHGIPSTLPLLVLLLAACATAGAHPDTRSTGDGAADGGGAYGGFTAVGGSGGDPFEACVEAEAEAEPVELDMVVLLDRSMSMLDDGKWPAAVGALESFFADPSSAGVHVGLTYFPPAPQTGSSPCSYQDYDDPLAVPIGELPANELTLATALDAASADGAFTPMYPALQGALFAATAYQDAHPTHRVVVVLASDGEPDGCPNVNGVDGNDIANISALSEKALTYDGVQTYAIAMPGAVVAHLDAIAFAGGTTAAYDVSVDISLFAAKMAEIQEGARRCTIQVPDPPNGELLDPHRVNVRQLRDFTGPGEVIPHVDGPWACLGEPGWYYDGPAHARIELCPASCDAVQADAQARLVVAFGCRTEVR